MFRNSGQHLRANFNVVMKGPREVGVAGFLKRDVRGTFEGLRRPANTKQRLVHPMCLRTRPLAHTDAKLIVFCPTFSVSIRSAITRNARASTAASASSLVGP